MTAVASLEGMARARFERAWAGLGPEPTELDRSPPGWLSDDLAHLLACAPERSAEEWAAHVRRLILEHNVVPESGGSVSAADWDARMDRQVQRQVQRIVAVLERVRQGMCEEGYWSDAPVTPLMCG